MSKWQSTLSADTVRPCVMGANSVGRQWRVVCRGLKSPRSHTVSPINMSTKLWGTKMLKSSRNYLICSVTKPSIILISHLLSLTVGSLLSCCSWIMFVTVTTAWPARLMPENKNKSCEMSASWFTFKLLGRKFITQSVSVNSKRNRTVCGWGFTPEKNYGSLQHSGTPWLLLHRKKLHGNKCKGCAQALFL